MYPAPEPSESHFLRRYHTYLLTPQGSVRPPPPSVALWFEEQYEARITQQVRCGLIGLCVPDDCTGNVVMMGCYSGGFQRCHVCKLG